MKITMQLLDVDYFMNNNRPIIRLFGKTENGQSVCGLVEKFMPYFYVRMDDRVPEILNELGLVWKEEYKRPSIGWKNPIAVAKIQLNNPQDVPRLREILESRGLTCYDADILFRYRFMIDHGLVGMGWVELDGNPVNTNIAKVPSFAVTKIKPIDPNQKRENANLRWLCVDIECIPLDFKRQMDPKYDPIIMISLAFNPPWRGQTDLVLVARPISGKGIEGSADEKSMLEAFLRIVEDFDPDIITGYNLHSFDLPWLAARMTKYGLRTDLGRCEKPMMIRSGTALTECYITGRVIFDAYKILRQDPNVRLHRYSLGNVLRQMLGENKLDVSYAEIPKLWSSDVHRLIEYARMDAILTLRLVLEKRMIDHYIELSRLSGVLLHDVFGGQTIRIETAVLHEFKRRNMLMPTKKSAEAEAIKGAVVLEPVVGLHKNVLVLDFASLYPSIIKNFNISPDTLVFDKNENTHVAPNGTRFLNKEIYEGVFPAIISRLLEERWAAKAAMASATGEERRILNVKQYAIKILCNSFYGYAGYNRARLYVSDVANAITAYGRENIKRTKELVEKQFGVRVLYADTDSLFIESKLDDLDSIYDLGKRISEYVSTQTGLQFEFEKIYKTFLILTKKRYAGLIIKRTKDGNWEDGGIDMRGIETVRRDWCEFVTETMQGVLETILRNNDIEGAVANVKQAIAQIKNGTVPLEKLTIVKGLTKAIGSYDGLLPHVQLARKLTARNPSAAPRVGERIGYVIVRGTGKLSERAEDPAYVKENNLALDVDYYINSQLLPPIERIFAALGVKKAELLGTGRQTNLFDLETREFFCTSCGRAWRRLPLRGLCDCGGKLANS